MTVTTRGAHNHSSATSNLKEADTSTLVLFDFDGTITTRDTLIEFVRFYKGKRKYWTGMLMLAPMLALFAFRIIPNWKAKQFFLAHYFKRESLANFRSRCFAFSTKLLPHLIDRKSVV